MTLTRVECEATDVRYRPTADCCTGQVTHVNREITVLFSSTRQRNILE